MAVTALITSLPVALTIWAAAVALLVAVAFLAPLRVGHLVAEPDPAPNYDAAVARFETDAAARPSR